jgi:ATP-binding cassette subfamily B protein
VYGELQRAAGSATRLLDLLKVESDIKQPDQPSVMKTHPSSAITFEHVNFSYPSRPDAPALYDINLVIPTGKTIALFDWVY